MTFLAHFAAYLFASRKVTVREDAIDWNHPLTRVIRPSVQEAAEVAA